MVLESTDDELARALATNTIAWAAGCRGSFAEAAGLMSPIVRWAERDRAGAADDTRPHLILGNMLVGLDRLDEAYRTIQRGRRAAETRGMVDQLAQYHSQAAYVDYLRGRLDDALAELGTHAQLADETGLGWRVLPYSLHALIALHRDDLVGAKRELAAAELEATGAPWLGTELMALARARLLESAGDVAAALDTIAGAFDTTAAGTGMAIFLPNLGTELARLAVAAGQPARAAGVDTELRRVAALNPGVGSLEAAALQARGLLAADDATLFAAVELMRSTGRALETARAAEDAATTTAAVELLEEARQIYARCGATRDLTRVHAAMRRFGIPRRSEQRRRPTTGWESLTDTELTVVRLVSERLTNPEIAERMFISRRTVQTHVSHALAKLGVGTRRDLADEAARRAGWRLRVEGVGKHTEQTEPAVEATRRPVVNDDNT
jgi:DNA-binding CsgD family transcriptional regulator